jgi:HK97 family phage major capsid protein
MITYLRRLVEERNALTGVMSTMSDKAAAEERDLTDHERGTIAQHQERCAELDKAIEEHKAQAESTRAWASLQDALKGLEPEERPTSTSSRLSVREPAPASWGETFIGSREFAEYRGVGHSGRVELGSLFEQRAAIDTSFVHVPPYVYAPGASWTMTTPLLDAMGKTRVSSGSIEWYTYPAAFPLAAVVAEGALKPEADVVPTLHTSALNTYAHWKAITRQALEDIPRIQSIVETQLRGGLYRKLEEDAAAALNAAVLTAVDGAGDLLAGIRIGIGTVGAAGYSSATTVLLNPADYAAIDVSVMGTAGITPQSQSTLWGVKVISAAAVPVGTAYVGDFQNGLTLFDRGTTAVMMTDSHADYFIRNMLLILAETRALPAVTEPAALVKVTEGVAPAAAGARAGNGR